MIRYSLGWFTQLKPEALGSSRAGIREPN